MVSGEKVYIIFTLGEPSEDDTVLSLLYVFPIRCTSVSYKMLWLRFFVCYIRVVQIIWLPCVCTTIKYITSRSMWCINGEKMWSLTDFSEREREKSFSWYIYLGQRCFYCVILNTIKEPIYGMMNYRSFLKRLILTDFD